MRLAGRFSRRIRGYAKAQNIPVIDCPAGQRKHDLAEEYLAKTRVTQGLFLVLVGRAQAPVWDASAKHHIERKEADDPDTGGVEIVRYTSIDDCGRAVNPIPSPTHIDHTRGVLELAFLFYGIGGDASFFTLSKRKGLLHLSRLKTVRSTISPTTSLAPVPQASRNSASTKERQY
jgi:hypothetical protein